MSVQYRAVYRKYIEQKYKSCTLCKKELELFISADFLPIEKSDFILKPLCKKCADKTWQMHQE